jgi:ankyrin repeat protein
MISNRKFFLYIIFLIIPFICLANIPQKAITSSTLFEASKKGDIDLMKKLLTFTNIAVNVTNQNGITPLMITSWLGFEVATKLLLECGANANLESKNNKDFDLGKINPSNLNNKTTALMLACFKGYAKIVKELLKMGAEVNAQDSDGQTPLMYTILGDKNWPEIPLDGKRKEIIEILLDSHANPFIKDNYGEDSLYYYSIVASLIKRYGRYESDEALLDDDPIFQRMKK